MINPKKPGGRGPDEKNRELRLFSDHPETEMISAAQTSAYRTAAPPHTVYEEEIQTTSRASASEEG